MGYDGDVATFNNYYVKKLVRQRPESTYRIELKLQEFRNCDETRLKYLQQELSLLENLKRLPDDVVDREDTGSTGPQ